MKQQRVRGKGKGCAMTVWVSEGTKERIQREAGRRKIKPSTLVREALEKEFNLP